MKIALNILIVKRNFIVSEKIENILCMNLFLVY